MGSHNFVRRAFTLVELLVVIGIIAVLVALLMPVMARVRYQARLANCASNERQYILAIRCYAIDHRGVLPRFDMGGTGQNIIDLSNAYYDELHKRYHLPFLSFYCPESPPKLEEVLFKAFGFFIDGYMIWTPRLNGGQQIPPDPGVGGLAVNGKDLIRGPIKLGDHLANLNPVISDIVLIHNEKVSNPNSFNLVRRTSRLTGATTRPISGRGDSTRTMSVIWMDTWSACALMPSGRVT